MLTSEWCTVLIFNLGLDLGLGRYDSGELINMTQALRFSPDLGNSREAK